MTAASAAASTPRVGPARPRPRVLILTDWYLPAYKAGGPIRSIANLVTSLAADVEFSIVAGDRDLGEREPFPGIETGRWVDRGDHRVCYLPPGLQGYRRLPALIAQGGFDAIHVNGLFSPLFSIYPLALRRLRRDMPRMILAPRGMLGAGALKIKSKKKQAFLTAARVSGLFEGLVWHATGKTEVDEIRAVVPAAHIELAPNLPNQVSGAPPARDKRPGAVRFCFFSRISPKKGLREGLAFLASVHAAGSIELDILGPIDDAAYWAECQPLIEALRGKVEVTYRGAVRPEQVHETLAGYHFLLLPTWNENYGHAIVDALAAGCPVVISDQTPWTQLEAAGAGWTLPLADARAFAARLQACTDMDADTFARHSRAAAELAAAIRADPDARDRTRALFT